MTTRLRAAGGMLAALATVSLAVPGLAADAQWKPANGPLTTRWAKTVTPTNVLPEYPRPQMVRKHWVNLNGAWDFAITGRDSQRPSAFDQKILVPYPVESAMSGVMKRIEAQDRMWYKRSISVPAAWKGQRVLLHFGAVDWESVVYIDGKQVGRHTGGYDPFSFDVTQFVTPGKSNEVVLSVWDPSNDGNQPVGKQSLAPGGCFYIPCSGIWQTAWLEAVPTAYITDFKMVPDIDKGVLNLTVNSNSSSGTVTAVAMDAGKKIAEVSGKPGQALAIPIKNAKLWSPDRPFLYNLKLTLKSGSVSDNVGSYFAMRKASIGKDKNGITRLLLNNKFVFQLGPLDQGYWPESNYTPVSEAAILYDLQMLKKSGFNMIRKHIKVEPARWYYWCDKMGFVVWQDMPSLALREPNAEGKKNYEDELERMINALYNVPSIIMWVPFNEAWGQFDTPRIVEKIRKLDPHRLINNASGWIDNKVGDVIDTHGYPGPWGPKPEVNRAAVIGEFGGLGMIVKGHTWLKDGWGYDLLQNQEDLSTRYEKLFRDLEKLVDSPGISAAVYTQVSDIEGEINGLMTYDREIIKIDPIIAANAARYLFPPTKTGEADKFIGETTIELNATAGAKIRYTTDGSNPTSSSALYTQPVKLTKSALIKAAAFLADGSVSRVATFDMKKVDPKPARSNIGAKPGLQLSYYEAGWQGVPDFDSLEVKKTYIASKVDLTRAQRAEWFALKFEGWVTVPETGVYTFYTTSDDCATLIIDGENVIDDPVGHGTKEQYGSIALSKGAHSLVLLYSQSTGGRSLRLGWDGPGVPKSTDPKAPRTEVPTSALSFTRTLSIQCLPPEAAGYTLRFVGETDAAITCPYEGATIYYTTDGSEPNEASTRYTAPIRLTRNTTIKAKAYVDGLEPSDVRTMEFVSDVPVASVKADVESGLVRSLYDYDSDRMPDTDSMTPKSVTKVNGFELPEADRYATSFDAYIRVPKTGVYAFEMHGDDQAKLLIAGRTVIERSSYSEAPKFGEIVLEVGLHPFKVIHSQGNGGTFVKLQIQGPGLSKRDLDSQMLFRAK